MTRAKGKWLENIPVPAGFELPKAIVKKIRDCADQKTKTQDDERILKYLWVYISDKAARAAGKPTSSNNALSREDWLNVLDESASLGAQWIVICVGTSLAQCPYIWDVCNWAQSIHDLKIGLHMCGATLTDDDIARLRQLEKNKTFLLVDRDRVEAFSYLKEKGLQVHPADVGPEDHTPPCDLAATMACIGPDGKLYTCGLVLGDENFALGNIQDRPLSEIMRNGQLPHAIPADVCHHEGGCNGCPVFVEKRALG